MNRENCFLKKNAKSKFTSIQNLKLTFDYKMHLWADLHGTSYTHVISRGNHSNRIHNLKNFKNAFTKLFTKPKQ